MTCIMGCPVHYAGLETETQWIIYAIDLQTLWGAPEVSGDVW
jgi:hypothetical protein